MTNNTDPARALETLRLPLEQLPDPLHIPTAESLAGPPPYTAKARVLPPGSKSLTNRALLLAALADGPSIITKPLLHADDAQRMIHALTKLGVNIEHLPASTRHPERLIVHGAAGALNPPEDNQPLFLNNAGTATRFLTAAATLATAPVTIDGNKRMRERPIAELTTLLQALGLTVKHHESDGFVPLTVTPGPLTTNTLTVPTTQSSQFISALCMIAPWLPQGLTLRFQGPITSRPYIDMTLNLMQQTTGTEHHWSDDHTELHIPHQPHAGFEYEVEPDASGATYHLAAAAILPGLTVRIPGLTFTSLQSDARFLLTLGSMGCKINYAAGAADCTGPATLKPIEHADFEPTPDAAMTLAAAAAFATGPTTITGLRTLRVKETDRIDATRNELARLSVTVKTTSDTMTIHPPPEGPRIDPSLYHDGLETYDDHRMAMSLALVAMRTPGVAIKDPACVAKTYPSFFNDLATIYDALITPNTRF